MIRRFEEGVRPAAVVEKYGRAVRSFLGGPDAWVVGEPTGAAWDRTYATLGRPDDILSPAEAETFLLSWQDELQVEMRRTCAGVSKAELFFALRTLAPGGPGGFELEPLSEVPIGAMAVRRVATHAALRFGQNPSSGYDAPYGGRLEPGDRERFAETLSKLLYLASYYMKVYGYRSVVALGSSLQVSYDSVRPDSDNFEESDWLTYSLDGRKHANYSPFARIGEFVADATPTMTQNGAALVSTRYERLDSGQWRYGVLSWGLAPMLDFLLELEPDLCVKAWGMRGEEFSALLAALCHVINDVLADSEEMTNDAALTSIVPLDPTLIEGDVLLRHAEGYLEAAYLEPGDFDLPRARERFLYLTCSDGKEEAKEKELSIQLADTRYSYFLHRFGRHYVADFFHADHWFHRPFELLSRQMTDEQSVEKGKRFERRLREYVNDYPQKTFRLVPELRGKIFERDGTPAGDLDCTFTVGSVLFVVEAKARLLRYPAETLYRRAVQDRWEEVKSYLEQAEHTARLLAARREWSRFRRGMAGIRYVLPLSCTPYPEWMHSLEDAYWIVKPDRTAEEYGVPRILTPRELVGFFGSLSEREIIEAAGDHLIEVSSIPRDTRES